MIEVKNLVKNYGSHKAVKNISFTVEQGKIYGFLGPNGAGKSTTMNIITGCLAATSGTVTINGHDIFEDPIAAKKCIGYLPEQPPLYLDMTPREYLTFVGEAKGLRGTELFAQLEEVIELTGIESVKSRLIKNLSKGYKQRVGIAQAMLGSPDIIILDEPTVGLDPIQIVEIRDLIRSLGKSHTVILSSHILTEVQTICDHVIMISKGHLVANDLISNLESKYTSRQSLELVLRADSAEAELVAAKIKGAESYNISKGEEKGTVVLSLSYPKDNDIREKAYNAVKSAGIALLAMIPKITTLEDIFIELSSAEFPEDMAPSQKEIEEKPESDEKTQGDNANNSEDDDKKSDGGDDDYKPLFS